jgi:HPt (histidine-containing phosphotransfer) domain-containing protein
MSERPNQDDDPIDRDVLAQLDFGEPPGEVLELLVATFLRHAPTTAEALADAGRRGDVAAAELAAHSLKSSARQFGALRLGDLCEAIERAAHGGELDPDAVAAAVAEFGRARAALESR